MIRAALRRHLPSVALFVGLIVLWQVAVSGFHLREYILPSLLTVLGAFLGSDIPWAVHVWVTAIEVLGAFLLGGAVGVALGTAIAWSPVLSSALVPFLVFVNTLPKVAVAPLFLLWLGYGILPNMMMGLELMKTERYAQHGIGWMDEKKMCQSVDLVNTYMGAPSKVECRAVFTNEYLTRIELPQTMRP